MNVDTEDTSSFVPLFEEIGLHENKNSSSQYASSDVCAAKSVFSHAKRYVMLYFSMARMACFALPMLSSEDMSILYISSKNNILRDTKQLYVN